MNLVVVMAAGLLLGADDASKKDLEKMQGDWKVVAIEANGEKAPAQGVENAKLRLIVKDKKFNYKRGDDELSGGTFEIDASKTPKTLDVSGKTKDGKNEKTIGIYELKGDTMRVCFVPEGKERPKEFSAKAGSGAFLIEYKRVK